MGTYNLFLGGSGNSFLSLACKSASFTLALFIFIEPLAPVVVYAQEVEHSNEASFQEVDKDSTGYDFAVQQGRAAFGDNYVPTNIRTIDSQTASLSGSEIQGSEPQGGGQTLMSMQSSPLIQSHKYDVAGVSLGSKIHGASGEFSYSVPILVPPGRNGMEPDLSLSYSSHEVENLSPVGYGWDIIVPYIQRINRHGVEQLYSKHFFLASMSGELATTSEFGVYQARSEDGSFLKYQYATSTNAWTVFDKAGNTYRFGHSTSTRQDSPTNSSEVYMWMLEEIRDTNDNYITYKYYKDDGFIYPQEIIYTGHGTSDGIFTVDFNLESRDDNATSTETGFEVRANYRVAEIVTSVNGQWVRKYELGYSQGDNDIRSLLSSITETGRDPDTSSTIALPATTFTYQAVTPGWATTTDFSIPEKFKSGSAYEDNGVRMADVNGDALVDIIYSKEGATSTVYINEGDEWVLDGSWDFPQYFVDTDGVDYGVRLVDVNGDGLVDVLRRGRGVANLTYLNTGSGWATSTSWDKTMNFVTSDGADGGFRFADVNGDGLVDILWSEFYPQYDIFNSEVFLNNGEDWQSSSYELPVAIRNLWNISGVYIETLGTEVADFNGDGLADIATNDPNQMDDLEGVFINSGSDWLKEDSWSIPTQIGDSGNYNHQYLADFNGDGFTDWLDASISSGDLYINTGFSWVLDTAWELPVAINDSDGYSAFFVDVDGDDLVDLVQRNDNVHRRYLNQTKSVDAITEINESTGAGIEVVYKPSAQYRDTSDELLNPVLPFVLNVVDSTTYYDGLGSESTVSYAYEGGDYYFSDSHNRIFAGFGITKKTDGEGNLTKTYYHQGNDTDSSEGEYNDIRSKIGNTYRNETYDGSENLYTVEVQKWDHVDLDEGVDFVKNTRHTVLTYDGDGDHRDSANTSTYSTSTGSVLTETEWGEVNASADGSFADTGTDKLITEFTYAASSTGFLIQPMREEVTDEIAARVRESKYYYDNLAFGAISTGNVTKEEKWISELNYIDVEYIYNTYGLVVEKKDPRDKENSYVYDTFNLYPATTTNALNHEVGRLYDYSSGKVWWEFDPNGFVFETEYDALDRVVEERQPNLDNPSTLVVRTTYQYGDDSVPRWVQKTSHLSTTTSRVSYTYVDGFDRRIQERQEAEVADEYVVKDYTYDSRGLLHTESLPYFSAEVVYTGTTTPPQSELVTTYLYDAQGRVDSVANVIGTTTTSYDQWVTNVVDAEGNEKEYEYDVRGNLVEVNEHNDSNTYTTIYAYNGNNNITQLIDASGNERNFTYDGLGRRLSSEDLHDSSDGTYGTLVYDHDDNGNLVTQTDSKGQTINYTYDDLSRLLTENYTGDAGIEVLYAYDSCTNGVGRLCSATSSGAVASRTYNALGFVAAESKVVDGTTYTTSYVYDRLGNQIVVNYPDASQMRYTYNTAGQLERVEQKESGSTYTDVVSNIDYGPSGRATFKEYANGIESSYTFDENELYRLRRLDTVTASSSEISYGAGGDYFANNSSSRILSFVKGVYGLLGRVVGTSTGEMSTTTEEEITIPNEMSQNVSTSSISSEASPPVDLAPETAVTNLSSEEIATSTNAEIENSAVPTIESEITPDDDVLAEDEPGVSSVTSATTPTDSLAATSTEIQEPVEATEQLELQLEGKSAREKAAVKGQFIVDQVKQGSYIRDGGFRIEVVKLQIIENGIEVYARVWQDNEQIGFGANREIDIERFLIYNPPVLVDDPDGEIVRNIYDFESEKKIGERRLREDPIEALLQVLEHTIAVKTQKGGSEDIVMGKIGNTTSVFFSEGDPEVSAVDGFALMHNDGWSFSSLLVHYGNHAGDSQSQADCIDLHAYTTSGQWRKIRRSIFGFDTSSIGSSIVDSATFSVYGSSNAVSDFGIDVVLDRRVPASATELGASDYYRSDWDRQLQSNTSVAEGSWNTSGYNDFPLNATGESNVNTTGVSWLGLRSDADFNETAPTWSSNARSNLGCYFADQTGTANDPKLVVEHSSANVAPTSPTLLETENLTNPTGVTDPTPEFSAFYNDPNATDLATHYQIQVATSSNFSNLYWDSASTTLASSTPEGTRIDGISYGGPSLEANETYYWQIRFWDDDGAEGAWSIATSTFSVTGPGTAGYESISTSSWLNSSSVSLTPPSGLEEGNLMLAVIAMDNNVGSPPTGWTLIDSGLNLSQKVGLSVYGKIAAADDVGTTTPYVFTGSYDVIAGSIVRVSNGDLNETTSTNYYKHSWEGNPVALNGGVTPSETDSLLLMAGHVVNRNNNVTGFTIPNDNPTWIMRANDSTSMDVEHFWGLGTASRQATSTTGTTYSISTDGTNQSRRGYGLLLYVPGNFAPSVPAGLLVEGETNPSNVVDATPEFSATYQDQDENDVATHYQIQVATSSDFTNIFWDSDKITLTGTTTEGSSIADISYAGSDLVHETQYYWRIKLWDDNQAESSWSDYGTFFYTVTGGNGILQDITFTYDSAGNIARIDEHSGTQAARIVSYDYDDLYRLTSASTTAASSTPYSTTYTYSPIGNILLHSEQGSYTYNETGYTNPHAVTNIASTTLTYDNNGNLIFFGSDSYIWDYRNRLIELNVGGATTTYGYDHNDQRVIKTVDSVSTIYPNQYYSVEGATSTKYIYAGDELIAYVEADGIATSTFYVHNDHLGSTNVTTNELGEVQSTKDYYPFGSTRIDSGDASLARGYIGQFEDGDDMSYLNARYYKSDNGRFTSQDPVFLAIGNPNQVKQLTAIEQRELLKDPQALNSYGYARNNPIRFSDPEGLWYREFLTGQQSWSSFQLEVGQATQYMTDNSRTWGFAVDHPYTTGAVVGFASAGAAQAGLYGTVALKAAAYPGVGTAYSASRVAEGAAYLYLAQSSLNNISSLLGQLSDYDPRNPTFNSSAKLIYNFGVEGASTFGGQKVGGVADTYNLISSALKDISRTLNKLKKNLNEDSNNKDKKK